MAKSATKKSAQKRKPARQRSTEIEVRASTRSAKARKGATKSTPRAKNTRRSSSTTVMGMSVPAGLSNALESLVNSPRGRKLLASALVAAAGAAAAALANAPDDDERDDRSAERLNETDPLKTATKDLSIAAAGALAEMATGAVQSLLPASLGGSKSKGRS